MITFNNLKKISAVIIMLLLVSGCKNKTPTIKELNQEKKITNSYIETISTSAVPFITLSNDYDNIIMSEDEISLYNEEIRKKTDMMYDIKNIKFVSKDDIFNYITSYKIPSLPKYSDGAEITNSTIDFILDNRNLSNIEQSQKIQWGIIVKRANLRSFPTDCHFYNNRNDSNFDNIQETELHVNTPLIIIHESKDRLWDFVITETYVGWVKKENIALANENDINFFINNSSFGIITAEKIVVDDVLLDMSVKLPFITTVEEGYRLVLPIKLENSFVGKKIITIGRDSAHIGYLPYTKKNVIIQAFKYEGVGYSWSGMNEGVDCSSYVSNVYGTFGFKFPRNTSSQNKSVGKVISLAGKSNQEKLKIIENNNPALLYENGHVMIYIGKKDGKNYIIHSNAATMNVAVTVLDNSEYLKDINRLVLLTENYC